MSSANPQRCFSFKSSAFNTSVEREYFINPGCFGDDVARWLISELRAKGYATGEQPDQEDFGWYMTFEVGAAKHDVVIAYRPGSEDGEGEWLFWIERHAGLVGSIMGKRKNVESEAIEAIQQTLTSSPIISSVRVSDQQNL